MITINQNRNHPPEPRTWKLMVGSWNVGVSAYFQGRISLAVRGAKKNPPGRRCTRTCPWAETGGSENLSWPVIQLDRKKMRSKKRPKNYQKDSSQDALPKIFHWIFQPQCFRCYTSTPGRATPCKTSCQADGFVPHPWKSTTTESYISTGTASEIVGKLRFWWFCVPSLRRERWVYTWQLMVSKTSFIGSPGLCFKCYMFVLGRVGVGTWQTRTRVFTRFMT